MHRPFKGFRLFLSLNYTPTVPLGVRRYTIGCVWSVLYRFFTAPGNSILREANVKFFHVKIPPNTCLNRKKCCHYLSETNRKRKNKWNIPLLRVCSKTRTWLGLRVFRIRYASQILRSVKRTFGTPLSVLRNAFQRNRKKRSCRLRPMLWNFCRQTCTRAEPYARQ